MGYKNAQLVFENWAGHPKISHKQLVILLFMANTASDADCPPRYYGGWQDLHRVSAKWASKASERTAEREVTDSLAALVASGCIVSSNTAGPGVNAEYALALHPDHTFLPQGTGRDVTWTRSERLPEAVDNYADSVETRSTIARGKSTGNARGKSTGSARGNSTQTPVEIPRKRPWKKHAPKENPQKFNEIIIENSQDGGGYVLDVTSPEREEIFAAAQNDDDFQNSIQDQYDAARDHLQTLEDHGTKLLAAVEESNPDLSLTQRVIEAANLARQRKGKAA
ncbi:hypothetical protein [Glutamicibacter halophytocola]|uniref:hypothetical protein n=1 Tax=Glutamicibacter halophytocola TaxID=1933880 RepID=UPI0015C548E2|nr:hypothetical protein [Glutamicibacter halophytocola]NQD42440.1 hypothetical protein [Glutamicibacter halophytocola]